MASPDEGTSNTFLGVGAAPLEGVASGAALPDTDCVGRLTGRETFRVAATNVLVAFLDGLAVCTDTLQAIEAELAYVGAASTAQTLRSQYEAWSVAKFDSVMASAPDDGTTSGGPNPQPSREGGPNPQPSVEGGPNPQPSVEGGPNPQPSRSGPNPQPSAPVAVTTVSTAATSAATE